VTPVAGGVIGWIGSPGGAVTGASAKCGGRVTVERSSWVAGGTDSGGFAGGAGATGSGATAAGFTLAGLAVASAGFGSGFAGWMGRTGLAGLAGAGAGATGGDVTATWVSGVATG
jgi:hypothetical protein